MEESIVIDKLDSFHTLTMSYDNLLTDIARLEEERDLVQVKNEIMSKKTDLYEFVVLTGTCPRTVKFII